MTIHSMRVNYYYCHIELQFIPLLSFLVFNPNSAINSLSTIWTNRHVKHYVFFPIVRFHEKLFFFSLQKIFICRVVTKIAYVRENTPQNIDSIKSYPTSSSGTTFLPSAILNPEDGWCTVLRQSHPIWATSTSKQAHTDALSTIRQAERFSLPTTKPALEAVLPQRWPATDISVTTTQT